MKIAIIEDDLIIQMYLERVATKADFDVVGTAENFEQAIKLIEAKKPSLVLLDIGLRGEVDGIETAKVIANRFEIPHVFMSGNSDTLTHKSASDTKPLGFIKKPIDEASLKNKLMEFHKELTAV
jgi:DNA-binding NarL/FixJ family response regulator